jgi:hypothetical protein
LVFGQNPYKTFNATGTGRSPGSSADVTDGGLTGSVSYSSGIYTWTVPSTGNYQLEVAGAAGGSNIKASRTGGSGAYLKSSLELTAGTQIKIVVGQKGIDNSNTSLTYTGGAGGGGTFIYKSDNTPLLVAGGGGGAPSSISNLDSSISDAHGKYDTTSGTTINLNSTLKALGGVNGLGGGTSSREVLIGAPGAGFLGDGSTANGGQGLSKPSWNGGHMANYDDHNFDGGFGGGGAAGNGDGNSSYSNYIWSGGGGGYSGGAGGGNSGNGDGEYGGGGGSYYVSGSLISGSSGSNTGHGYAKITQLFSGGSIVLTGTSSTTHTFNSSTYDPSFSSSVDAVGGTAPITYQWQSSTDGTNYSDISGATSASYDPSAISLSIFYRRKVTDGSSNVQYSNVIKIYRISKTLSSDSGYQIVQYKTHSESISISPIDTFVVPSGVTSISYLVVGGGGGAGNGYDNAGGGGAGGGMVLQGNLSVSPSDTYNITVGLGGAGGANARTNNNGTAGNDSKLGTVIGKGGGAGGGSRTGGDPGVAQDGSTTAPTGGNGNGGGLDGDGGGGATGNGTAGGGAPGVGGAGLSSSITGSSVTYGAGGNGGYNGGPWNGASGGSGTGKGGVGGSSPSSNSAAGGNGGSGIVILKYSLPDPSLTVSSTHTVSYGDANFTITSTSSSTGAITYSTSDSAIADVNSSTGEVEIISNGTVTLTATQAYSSSYASDTATMVLTVNKKALTVNGIIAEDKVYNGTTSATIDDSSIAYNGLINEDDVTVSFTGVFSDADVGTGKTVTLTGTSSGSDVGKYTITNQATTTASITAKPLSINGITAEDKTYDGTTSATLDVSGIAYNGKVAGDNVTATFTGVFSDVNTEVGKTVTLTGTATGTDVGNYDITFQTSTTATITAGGGSGTASNYTYTGNYQTVTLNPGSYKLEVWGAEGGRNTTNINSVSGKGGYAKGTITLTSNTTAYIYVGGKGVDSDKSADSCTTCYFNGGFNGGGRGVNGGAGGGGASDIRLVGNTVYDRVIVAGGAGGVGYNSGTYSGGYGGGTSGGSVSLNYSVAGATQTTGYSLGQGQDENTSTNNDSGGGGGGFYGGYGGINNNTPGTGGSGNVYTSTSEKPSGYNLGSQYYLTDTSLIAGNASIPDPEGGSNTTGRSGNGYVKITPLCDSSSLTVSSTKTVYANDANFTLNHTSDSNGTLTYSSSNDSVATIDSSTGEVDIISSGTVTFTVSQAAYNDYCASSTTMVLTVNKTQLTIVPTSGLSKTYGDSDPTLTYTVSHTSTVTFTGTLSRTSGDDVGTYSYTVGTLSNDSYSAVIASDADSFEITQKALTINGITANDKTYDGTTSATLDVSGIAYNGKVAGDNVTATFTGVFSDANTEVGKTVTLTGTATGTDVGNYDITYQTSTTATITAGGGNGETYNFTNASVSGRLGPTQSQVNTAYSGTNLDGSVTINTQGIQEWTVPETGSYQIKVAGGQGGSITYSSSSSGGRGVIVQGSYSLVKGNVLKIAVGHQGVSASGTSYNGAGGGGGSFVVLSTDNVPLFIAGGGGGDAAYSGDTSGLIYNGKDAVTNIYGTSSYFGAPAGSPGEGGKSHINGSSTTSSNGYDAGAGGGFNSDGYSGGGILGGSSRFERCGIFKSNPRR